MMGLNLRSERRGIRYALSFPFALERLTLRLSLHDIGVSDFDWFCNVRDCFPSVDLIPYFSGYARLQYLVSVKVKLQEVRREVFVSFWKPPIPLSVRTSGVSSSHEISCDFELVHGMSVRL